MLSNNGTYYLGRVIKIGTLDHEKLIKAILNPKPILAWGFAWSFISAQKGTIDGVDFVYAKLCKYSPDAEVMIVVPEKGEEKSQEEPNLRIASSPFIYIPEFSGIAFLRVSTHVEPHTFMKRFATLVKNKYDNFFVDCKIEAISDLRTFAIKLSKLESIVNISATISPPNPLFGHLWEDLKKYLDARRTDKMKIQEESFGDKSISTNLPSLIENISEHTSEKPFMPSKVDIGDAAILMAADGYGTGYVKGRQQGEMVVIKTSETIKNFSFSKEAVPEDLFRKVYDILNKINEDRHMKHNE